MATRSDGIPSTVTVDPKLEGQQQSHAHIYYTHFFMLIPLSSVWRPTSTRKSETAIIFPMSKNMHVSPEH